MALDILVVDDETDIRELVAGVLEDEGYETRGAADSDAALDAIATRRPSLVLLDVWLQGSRLDGLELLDEIKRRDPSIPVLVISGHGNLDTAVAAIRKGAADFIEKPFDADTVVTRVREAIASYGRHVNGGAPGLTFPGAENLTPRERDVLQEITGGASNKEAGRRLGISPRTIEVHRARIMEKLGARNAADLVRIVLTAHTGDHG